MNIHLDTDRDLRRYLLGDLGDEARDALELRLLADEELSTAVLAVEDDLIDDYARGRLSATEGAAFETHLLPRPGMGSRIAFARSLERALAGPPSPASPHRLPWSERVAAWLGGLVPAPALRFAGAAAMLLLVVAAGWLALENVRLDQRLARLEADREARVAEQSTLRSDLETRAEELDALSEERDAARAAAADGSVRGEELAAAQRRIEELEGEVTGLRRKPPPRRVAVSFLLALATRGAGVPELAVPAAAEAVTLHLDTAGDDAFYDAFRVRVLGPGGAQVWGGTGLPSDPATGAVDVELPAAALTPGRYEVLLEGVSGNGAAELVGAYEIVVRRP